MGWRAVTTAAADPLRRLLPPGSTLCVTVEVSRSGKTARAEFRALRIDKDDISGEHAHLATCTADVAAVLGLRYVATKRAAILPDHGNATGLADELSVALYGEPGQIKGEML